jgi:hypothetical protein
MAGTHSTLQLRPHAASVEHPRIDLAGVISDRSRHNRADLRLRCVASCASRELFAVQPGSGGISPICAFAPPLRPGERLWRYGVCELRNSSDWIDPMLSANPDDC